MNRNDTNTRSRNRNETNNRSRSRNKNDTLGISFQSLLRTFIYYVCYRLTQILQHHQSAALHAEMGKCMVLLKRHTEAIVQYELALR